MTREFENMLYLFGAAATGKNIDIKNCENLSKIRELALSQGVWDVIYGAVREKLASGEVSVPPEVYVKLEKTFMSNVALNIRKVEFNMNTLRKLEENGVKCCVLKGTTVARLYSMPETRISSDMDIVIDEENEEKTAEILKSLGYACETRAKHDHHMKAYHKIGGLLEVHVALHSVPTNDILLDDEIRYKEDFILLDDGIHTLGVNDGLIYLSAHLIKHLINDATGVRQMMDLLLYMKAYEKEIEWEKYYSLMKKLGYDTLIAVVKGIGVKYFGMELDGAITEGSGMEELLEDCEIGGAFGKDEKEREQFYHLYVQKKAGNTNLGHSLYRLTRSERSVIRMLFPKFKEMKKRFRYVNKFPILLPVGWIHRIIELILKQLGIIKQKEEISTVCQRRMEMVEKLGMFKNGENK